MMGKILGIIILVSALASPCSMVFSKVTYRKNLRSNTPLFRFERDGKAGFINALGKVVIPPTFDVGWFSEEDFVEGLSPARSGESWGFVDVAGKWSIQPKFWRVETFSDGLAAVTYHLRGTKFPMGYINKNGATVFELPDEIGDAGPFSEGLAYVRKVGYTSSGKVGYIDRSGRVVISFEFASGGPFRNGLAAVVFDGKCFIEARDGKGRGTPPSVPAATSCGGVPSYITQRCQEGFIDKTGHVVFRFDVVRDFSEGVAAVESSGVWGFIESTGKFRIRPQFEAAHSFHNGLAAAKVDGKWGYINQTGEWIIRPTYSVAEDFNDGLALTDRGFIDRTGTHVASAKNATAFVQGLAHVELDDGEVGYINHSGKVVFRYRPEKSRPSMLPYSSN